MKVRIVNDEGHVVEVSGGAVGTINRGGELSVEVPADGMSITLTSVAKAAEPEAGKPEAEAE